MAVANPIAIRRSANYSRLPDQPKSTKMLVTSLATHNILSSISVPLQRSISTSYFNQKTKYKPFANARSNLVSCQIFCDELPPHFHGGSRRICMYSTTVCFIRAIVQAVERHVFKNQLFLVDRTFERFVKKTFFSKYASTEC